MSKATYIVLCLHILFLENANGTTLSVLIPRRTKMGRPANTYGCSGDVCNDQSNCFCEEHCSWDVCRLEEPPNDCLYGTKSIWKWDHLKNAWVAQLLEGKAVH